jgi:hypothetical protein
MDEVSVMGFLDKLKGAVNAVTGGAAKVQIEYPQNLVFGGDMVPVKITATSTGAEVKSKGIFVDLEGVEDVSIRKGDSNVDQNVSASKRTFEQQFQIAPAFVLAAGGTQLFEGQIQLPATALPSFRGNFVEHKWQIRGRVEATGNDPDSGWKPIRLGAR